MNSQSWARGHKLGKASELAILLDRGFHQHDHSEQHHSYKQSEM
jgi:hypothetical protein